ncbi:MAG: putative glycoside hydrolase [Patescibacteria group bacterium]
MKWLVLLLFGLGGIGGFLVLENKGDLFNSKLDADWVKQPAVIVGANQVQPQESGEPEIEIVNLPPPEVVRGIYITSWVAGTPTLVNNLINFVENSPLNAVVIDIKAEDGLLSYQPLDLKLKDFGSGTNRIRKLPELIKRFNDKGIYVIGRLSAFQDPFLANKKPALAFKNTKTGNLWVDRKGLAWVRSDKEEVWEYLVKIARDAYAQGFDEINIDYIRFPSDGTMAELESGDFIKTKTESIKDFVIYLDQELRQESGIPLSVDLFGLAMSSIDGVGIGQHLEDIVPYVDYISPMIYPSHYASGSFGYTAPAHYPYEIVLRSLTDGLSRLEAINQPAEKIRPWLQDFNIGATYDRTKIEAQIKAVTDAGLNSWIFWDPKNVYTKEAYYHLSTLDN